jgi:hypothetical protein
MDIPKKVLIVTDNVVTGFANVFSDTVTVNIPDGSTAVELPIDSPVSIGWRYSQLEDDTWGWIPPVRAASVNLVDGGDAGNGNPPPPPPKNGG